VGETVRRDLRSEVEDDLVLTGGVRLSARGEGKDCTGSE
jgi:hypothetical protein